MKVLGISFGRKMGNSEIFIKEALMAAEELGAEVEILRAQDLNIKPCNGCEKCALMFGQGKTPRCSIKDDMPFFAKKYTSSDAVIVAAPIYFLGPTGYVKIVVDRLWPTFGIFCREEAEGKVQKRPAAFITVGGGQYDWVSLGLSQMQLLRFSGLQVVDQLSVTGSARPGQLLLNDAIVTRARELGRNVTEAISKPVNQMEYKGEEPEFCPVCHSNILMRGRSAPVECPICGTKGSLKIEGDRVTFIIDEESVRHSRVSSGLMEHLRDIGGYHREYEDKKHLIPPMLKKYKSYKSYSKPDRKKSEAN